MRTRHIEIFHAIYAAGSISQAASVLNVSQPALSKALRLAEQELGFPLFERAASGLVPTREADELYTAAARVKAELAKFQAVARDVQLRRRTSVRIAMAPSIAMSVGANAVARFAERYPDINLHVETMHYDEVVAALRDETIDVAVMYHPSSRPGLRVVPLTEGKFVCLVKADTALAAKGAVSLADLVGHPIIQLSTQAPLGQLLSQHVDAQHPPSRVIVANTYYLALSMAERGLGLAVVDEFAAQLSTSDQVAIVPLREGPTFDVGAMLREGHSLSKAEAELLDDFGYALTA
ncbi:MAG: LysR family transcriptional regulator [Pseudomonadota bacterium]